MPQELDLTKLFFFPPPPVLLAMSSLQCPAGWGKMPKWPPATTSDSPTPGPLLNIGKGASVCLREGLGEKAASGKLTPPQPRVGRLVRTRGGRAEGAGARERQGCVRRARPGVLAGMFRSLPPPPPKHLRICGIYSAVPHRRQRAGMQHT